MTNLEIALTAAVGILIYRLWVTHRKMKVATDAAFALLQRVSQLAVHEGISSDVDAVVDSEQWASLLGDDWEMRSRNEL